MGSKRRVMLAAQLALVSGMLALVATGAASGATQSRSAPPHWAARDISHRAALDGISCTSRSFCAAIDESGKAYTWNGTGWSKGAQIASSAPYGRPYLLSVACASRHFCVAGGLSGQVWRWDGTSWASFATLGGFGLPIDGVSCPSAHFCAAVDNGGRSFVWNGSSWSSGTQVAPQPPFGVGGGDPLNAVSCTSSSSCVAVDDLGQAYTFDGSAWSSGTRIAGESGLHGVSCVAAKTCVAVSDAGRTYTSDGKSWSTGVRVTPGFVLSGVSCRPGQGSLRARCLAVDARGEAYRGTVFRHGASNWAPAGSLARQVPLGGVSCIPPGPCAAVDLTGGVHLQSLPSGAVKSSPPPATPTPKIAYRRPVTYALDGQATSVASGDFGNGQADLAVAVNSSNGSQLAVLLGNGHGGYRRPVYYPLPESPASGVVAADLRGSGRDDVAVLIGTTSTPEVAVLDSRRGGTFAAPVTYQLQGFAQGQGNPPALTAFHLSSRKPPSLLVDNLGFLMPLLVNRGNGTFTSTALIDPRPGPKVGDNSFAPYKAAIGDLSGSGTLDVGAPLTTNGLSVGGDIKSISGGGYRPATSSLSAPQGGLAPYSTQAALRLALPWAGARLIGLAGRAGGGSARISRYWVGPQGAIAPTQALTTSALIWMQAGTVGRFGSDRAPGVAAIDLLHYLAVIPSDGHRLLAPVRVATLDPSSYNPFDLTSIDRPGRPSDLAITADTIGGAGEVLVYRAS